MVDLETDNAEIHQYVSWQGQAGTLNKKTAGVPWMGGTWAGPGWDLRTALATLVRAALSSWSREVTLEQAPQEVTERVEQQKPGAGTLLAG